MLSTSELFRRTDDGQGGWIQTKKRWLKLYWRVTLHRTALQTVAQALAHPVFALVPETDPAMLLRPVRSYLWTALSAEQRAQALSAHLAWLRLTWFDEKIKTLYGQSGLPIMTVPLTTGHLSAALWPGRELGREGELALHLSFNNQLLLRTAFSILPGAMLGWLAVTQVMVLGCLQGSVGQAELLKACTAATHRSRPKALLLDIVQGLCAGWSLPALVGVKTSAHAYASYRSLSRRVAINYDATWTDLGATETLPNHWRLPLTPVLRDESEVPSRKRAEYRRRAQLRQTLYNLGRDWAATQVGDRLTDSPPGKNGR